MGFQKKKLRLLLVKRRAIKREKEGKIMEKGSRGHRGRKVVQVFICCESTSLKRKKKSHTKKSVLVFLFGWFLFYFVVLCKEDSPYTTRGTSRKIFAKIETLKETSYQEEGWREVGASSQVRQGGDVLIIHHLEIQNLGPNPGCILIYVRTLEPGKK